MPIIDFSAFNRYWDRRGSKLLNWRTKDRTDGSTAVLLECSEETAAHLADSFQGLCEARQLSDESKKLFTHGFLFPGGASNDVEDFLTMLQGVVVIPPPAGVDHAVALDWYTVPDEETGGLVNTDMGNYIRWTKHASHPEYGNSVRSRGKMVDALVDFASLHPIYAATTSVFAAPGHNADGDSFGEGLARQVAQRLGKPFIESSSAGPRPAQKEQKQDLTSAFRVEAPMSGAVLFLDDVYQSGGSAAGGAAAALRGGADSVHVLTVARTIHS